MSRLPLFWQVLAAFVLLVMLPLVMLLGWQQWQAEQRVLESKRAQLLLLAQEKRQQLDVRLQMQKSFVAQAARDPRVARVLALAGDQLAADRLGSDLMNELRASAERFLLMHGHYDWLLVSSGGRVVYSLKEEFDLGADLNSAAWQSSSLASVYDLARLLQSSVVQGFSWYDPSARLAAFVASPVYGDDGRWLGVLVVQMNREWLDALTHDRQGLGVTGEVVLGYRQSPGVTLPLTRPRYAVNAERQAAALAGGMIPLDEALSGHEGVGEGVDYRGEAVVSAWLYDMSLQAGLVVKQDLSEVMAPMLAQRRLFLWSLAVLLPLMLAGVWLLSRRLSSPIEVVADQVRMMGLGLDNTTLPESLCTTRELSLLVTGVNATGEQLMHQMDLLEGQAAQLEEQAADLEMLNEDLEQMVAVRTAELDEYIRLVDEQVITSRTDLAGNITHVSEAFARISGYGKEELLGRKHGIVRHPDMPVSLYEGLWRTITTGGTWQGEIKNMKKDGDFYWVDAVISPTYDRFGNHDGYMAVRQDITGRKRVEEMVIRDEMTGLFNRRHFNDQVMCLWRQAARTHQVLAFVLLDVDFFKQYNDTQGHMAGDDALKAVAQAMRGVCRRATDLPFRLGGEEMAVLSLVESPLDAELLGRQVRVAVENMALAHPASEASSVLTVSVGVCLFDGRRTQSSVQPDVDRLYQMADKALYAAKSLGRNRVESCASAL